MVSTSQSPLGKLIPRRAAALIDTAMRDTRVVLLNGARQSGKSTLAASISDSTQSHWTSLDRASTRVSAQADPTQFVREYPAMIIDEVQRVPELLLAIKEVVDFDATPGHFLLTGSSHVLSLRTTPDALPGRMETIELWPLSQGEIDSCPDGFVDAAFREGPQLRAGEAESRSSYVHRLVRGGFPEAVAREGQRRKKYHQSYVADLINREVVQLSQIERGPEMRALVKLLAVRNGNMLVVQPLSKALGIAQGTVAKYLALLEEIFLVKRIPAWASGETGRVVRAPKIAFVDSGIAAAVLGHDEAGLARVGSPVGALLEGFVASEISRQLTWSQTQANLFHYRTKDQVEVDLVLENDRGEVIGIEVKATSTLRSEDFSGLRHLASRLSDRFLAGYVLYLGDESLPMSDKLRGLPLNALWKAGA
ncbi:MAG: ATP-binding protein [Propionibacteriaceae bacterium]|jgi:predicted AAA+ superfamily ATPase|nr:ATP-binding protein [Propionibacteriaceae bacterium]